LDDLIGQGSDTLISRRVEPQINLSAGADGADKSFQLLARCKWDGEVVMVMTSQRKRAAPPSGEKSAG
jgi:hypothetical protein